jgi:hypothetical protein
MGYDGYGRLGSARREAVAATTSSQLPPVASAPRGSRPGPETHRASFVDVKRRRILDARLGEVDAVRLARGLPMQRALALAFALAAVVSIAAPVSADCSRMEPSKDIGDYRGLAFIATITDIDGRRVDGLYRVMFDVEREFAGDVPDPLAADDAGSGCGALDLPAMRVGQRVFVAADQLDEYERFGNTFADVLVWRQAADGRWRFFDDALWAGGTPRLQYPPEAWDATTLDEILALVAPARLPETDTAPEGLTRLPPSTHPDPFTRFLAVGFLALTGFGLGRRVSARRS